MHVTLQKLLLLLWSVLPPSNPADRLGVVRARLAAIRREEKVIEERLKREWHGRLSVTKPHIEVVGRLFRALVVHTERESVSWQKVALHFEPSHQLIAAHTTRAEYLSVRLSSHLKTEARASEEIS